MRIMKWFFLIYCFLALIAVLYKFIWVPQSAEFFGAPPPKAKPKPPAKTAAQLKVAAKTARADSFIKAYTKQPIPFERWKFLRISRDPEGYQQ